MLVFVFCWELRLGMIIYQVFLFFLHLSLSLLVSAHPRSQSHRSWKACSSNLTFFFLPFTTFFFYSFNFYLIRPCKKENLLEELFSSIVAVRDMWLETKVKKKKKKKVNLLLVQTPHVLLSCCIHQCLSIDFSRQSRSLHNLLHLQAKTAWGPLDGEQGESLDRLELDERN